MTPRTWHPQERIIFDGNPAGAEPVLDEIVIKGVNVHLEAMGIHSWWGEIDLPTGGTITLNFSDLSIDYDGDVPPVTFGPDLLYGSSWTGDGGLLHACDRDWPRSKPHDQHRCRCECGRRKPAGGK